MFKKFTKSTSTTASSSHDASQFTPPKATHWPSTNFVLAAGTATFQPSTRKVVVIKDTAYHGPGIPVGEFHWFLPRGRKDIGETIEACAIRETLEEAGYVASLFRALLPTHQPENPTNHDGLHSEAIHIQVIPGSLKMVLPTRMTDMRMYLAFWYICVIPPSATREADYGTHFVGSHEKGYDSQLLDVAEAVNVLSRGRLEYRYPNSVDGKRVPGVVLEKETRRVMQWDDVDGSNEGMVEAMIVAKGWELISAAEEWEDVEE